MVAPGQEKVAVNNELGTVRLRSNLVPLFQNESSWKTALDLHENEHVGGRFRTRTRFDTEVKGNSEIHCSFVLRFNVICSRSHARSYFLDYCRLFVLCSDPQSRPRILSATRRET